MQNVVRKQRTILLAGPTRVRLDQIENLGEFVELEAVLRPGQSVLEGRAPAPRFLTELGIPPDPLVDRVYIDLLP